MEIFMVEVDDGGAVYPLKRYVRIYMDRVRVEEY